MELATKQQKLAIRRNCGYNEEVKCELVQWVKNDNTKTSLNELSFDEANQILIQQGDEPHKAEKWAFFDNTNAKHKAILSLLYQCNWTTSYKGKDVPDLDRFSQFLQTKSPVKKPLKKQSPAELEKVIKALTNIAKGIWK
jgi:hypothetical protein